MHLIINAYHICQWRVFILPHILIPLFDGIPLTSEQVQLGITHLGIVGNQQEEVFKITDAVNGTYPFRIIDVDEYKTTATAFAVVYLAYFGVEFYPTLSYRFIIVTNRSELIVLRKVQFIFYLDSFTYIHRHIRIIVKVHAECACLILDAEYFQVFIIEIDQKSIFIIEFHAYRNV